MARRSGLGKSLSQIMEESSSAHSAVSPLIESIKAARVVDASAKGEDTPGASIDLTTGHAYTPGKEPVYMVGGTKDGAGNKYEEVIGSAYDAKNGRSVNVDDITRFRESIRKRPAGAPGNVLGIWAPKGRGVVFDVASVHRNRDEAVQTATNRGEEAVWDNKNIDEIRTEHWKGKTCPHCGGDLNGQD